MPIGLLLVILLIILAALAVPSVRFVPEAERLVVLRLGRYVGVRGPGLVLIAPVIDSSIRVNLDEVLPGWRGLSAEDVSRLVRKHLGL